MQIVPSGGWAGAASAQQSMNEAKHTHVHATPAPNQVGTERLEHGEKSSDRDANERYDGPQQNPSDPQSENNNPDSKSNRDSMLQLPADDEAPPQELDLLG